MAVVEELGEKKVFFLRQYDSLSIGIFGSYARGEAHPDSDLDLLVERAISPYLIDRIKAELKVIYQ